MSNIPSVPTAPSQGALPAPPTAKDGGGAPVPPLGSVEVAGQSGVASQLTAGAGVALTAANGAVAISAAPATLPAGSVPAAAIAPGANGQVLQTNASLLTVWGPQPIPPSVLMPALNVDWSAGGVFRKTLAAGASAVTFSNQADGQTIVVALTGAPGGSTVSWPAGVRWAGGVAPTQTATGNDVYTFVDVNGTIYGSVVQNLS